MWAVEFSVSSLALAEDADPGPKLEESQQAALAQLSQRGVLVQPLAVGSNWYYVNFRGVEKTDAAFLCSPEGAPVAIVDLFIRQKVTDADLAPLAGLKNLRKLSLARSSVTDSGLALEGAPEAGVLEPVPNRGDGCWLGCCFEYQGLETVVCVSDQGDGRRCRQTQGWSARGPR
jgi:hypothetical protein